MKKIFNIGMRTFKTALCVLTCLTVYEILSFVGSLFEGGAIYGFLKASVLDGSPSFACIAAVICMQDNMARSKKVAVSRIIGSVVGGGFAVLFLSIEQKLQLGRFYVLFAALGVILIIQICNYFNNPVSVSISVITFLIVFVGTDMSDPIYFSFNRVIGTLIGASSSLFINRFICPAKEE